MPRAKTEQKARDVTTIVAESYVPYFLSKLNNSLSWGASRLYREIFGVGLNEWRVLSSLNNEPGIRANRICEMVALNKSVVSRSARALEESGHICNVLEDGRRVLYLTPLGEALHDEIIEVALMRESSLLEGINAEEKAVLCGLLQRMQDNLANVDAQDKETIRRHKLQETD